MEQKRIKQHPIISIPKKREIQFFFNGTLLLGFENEMISSALISNGIQVFGHHHKDQSSQGIFCANGQCSQCLVIVNGHAVKACMTPLKHQMNVYSVEGLPQLPPNDTTPHIKQYPLREVEVLIIGAGPAGMSAAIELGRLGIDTLIIDDKDQMGGKLVLQTHKFFGSIEDSHAGTRGFEIAHILQQELQSFSSIEIWLQSTAVGVFSDQIIGIVKNGMYRLVKPEKLLIATGAREKMLSFPGNTLTGIYGAGAFQTLVNRDLVKCSQRVLIVGGGNVGLIAGYHAIQAQIEVVALIEALPKISGYTVHADKLKRLGVPIYTSHTIVSAHGTEHVQSVTIAELDSSWNIIHSKAKTFEVDTILIAVGLDEVNEFYHKAKNWGMEPFIAGDAHEIAEASAAMFTGKIEGLKIAKALRVYEGDIPVEWDMKAAILKSKPGQILSHPQPKEESGVFPLFHCYQEVPCNPCTSVCPEGAIKTEKDVITGLPYIVDVHLCKGCLNCVAVCPGLSVTVVDYRHDPEHPLVTVPYEIWREKVLKGASVTITDKDGAVLGTYPVSKVITMKKYPGTLLVQVSVEKRIAKEVVGIWVQEKNPEPLTTYEKQTPDDTAIVCRCERVSAGEIRQWIRNGLRDMNQLKAVTRAGMGACGGKTCRSLIYRIFREEKVDMGEVTDRTDRPLFVEVPLGVLAGSRKEDIS